MANKKVLAVAGVALVCTWALFYVSSQSEPTSASGAPSPAPYSLPPLPTPAAKWAAWQGAAQCDKELRAQFNVTQRAEYVFEFARELRFVDAQVRCGVPLSFVRFGDGEHALINGRSITAQSVDKWDWKGKESLLGADVRSALAYSGGDRPYYVALPCEDWRAVVDEFFAIAKQPTRYVSYATLFINRNYEAFLEVLKGWTQLHSQRRIVVMANWQTQTKAAKLDWVDTFVPLPDDCVNEWEKKADAFKEYFKALALSEHNALFLLSGGPMAKAAVYYMTMANPDNAYIDLGSALDELLKGQVTRPYQLEKDNYYRKHFCHRYRRHPSTNKLDLAPQHLQQ